MSVFRHCPACGSTRFVIDSEKSKCCRDCGFVYFMNPCAATVAVILRSAPSLGSSKELLTVRRAKEPARGTLDLPGGFCDCRETAEEGVAREVLEETGLRVVESRYLFSIPNIYHFGGMDIHTMDLFFACRVDADDEARAMDDAAEIAWTPIDQIHPEAFGLTSIRRGVEKLFLKNFLLN